MTPEYPLNDQDVEDLRKNFTYHKPKDNQQSRYIEIRDSAFHVALLIKGHTPKSREQSLAITKLEEAVMWANAAIARNE